MKRMGERNAGNPHVAFDVEGAGNVAQSIYFGLAGAPVLDPTDDRRGGNRAGLMAHVRPSSALPFVGRLIPINAPFPKAIRLAMPHPRANGRLTPSVQEPPV
jgi:hypothetical protein